MPRRPSLPPAGTSSPVEVVDGVPLLPAQAPRLPRGPMKLEDLRHAALVAAGITPALLQKAVWAIEEALNAETSEGKPNHYARLQAAREVLQVAGAYPSRSAAQPQEPVEITIHVAPFARGK
jgi:hypothetical protein